LKPALFTGVREGPKKRVRISERHLVLTVDRWIVPSEHQFMVDMSKYITPERKRRKKR
jgi:hypothetical protein